MTVRDGLVLVHRSQVLESIEMLSLLQALCRCVDVVKVSYLLFVVSPSTAPAKFLYNFLVSCQWLEQALLQDRTNSWGAPDGTQPSSGLRSKLFDVVEDILLLLLNRFRQMKIDSDRNMTTGFRQSLLDALNHVSSDSSVRLLQVGSLSVNAIV